MNRRSDVPEAVIGGPAWRTVPRQRVDELLLLGGFLFELRDSPETALASLRSCWSGAPARLYDPAEILNALIAEGLRGHGEFWRTHYVTTARALMSRLCGSPDWLPPNLSALKPQRFDVIFRRTFGPHPSIRRLRMPLPLESAHLTELQVEAAMGTIGPGRLEVKAEGTRGLEADLSFLAHAGLPAFENNSADARQVWLAEREGPIQVTAAVRALAARLAGSEPSPFEQVMAFWDHLLDTMTCGMIHPGLVTGAATDWVIGTGWFDCRLGAALLAALCRARGIPARLVGGYLLWDAPTEHYWMEAWLPDRGWTPFDLLAWDLSAGGTDRAWRNVFAGAVDYRMKTQVFPNLFTGAPCVPMGKAWHRLSRAITDGVETRFISIPDGELIYSDQLRVFKA